MTAQHNLDISGQFAYKEDVEELHSDEGEESDEYDVEDEQYRLEEEEDEEDEEEDEDEPNPENLTAELLGEPNHNGTNVGGNDEEEDEDADYKEGKEGVAENPTTGSKRGRDVDVDELEGDAEGEEDDEGEQEETVAKKARV